MTNYSIQQNAMALDVNQVLMGETFFNLVKVAKHISSGTARM